MRSFIYAGKTMYVRCVGASRRPEFRWEDDSVWFAASSYMWDLFSADALRQIAEAKEAK